MLTLRDSGCSVKERGISNFIIFCPRNSNFIFGPRNARVQYGVLDASDTSASIKWRVPSGAIAIHCPRFKFYESIPSQDHSESFKT